jgi:hypothetical protein
MSRRSSPQFQKVEGVHHRLADGTAAVQSIEHSDAIRAHTTASRSIVNDVHCRAAAVRVIAG